MGGFEQLPAARLAHDALGEFRTDEIAFGSSWTDETALKVVIQDVQNGVMFVNSKSLPSDWEDADNLYRALVSSECWPGTDVPRANLSVPVVLEVVEKLMPVIFMSIFSDRMPFRLSKVGNTTPEAARASEHILMWAIRESGFKEEIRKSLKNWLLYGFTVVQWGWQTVSKTKKSYDYDESTPADGKTPRKVKAKSEKYEISHPTIETLELRNVFFDSTLRSQDVRKGGWVCCQLFIDAESLTDLASEPGYKNVPTKEQLRTILGSKNVITEDSMSAAKDGTYRDLQAAPQTAEGSIDPLKKPLEILEYVCDDRVITVLQRVIVIRNEANRFGKKNFLSAAFIDVPGAAYGFGVAKLTSGEQRFQVGVINSWIDQLALVLNPSFHLQKGMGQGTQSIQMSPGKVINENGILTPIQIPSVSAEALGAVQSSEVRATRRVGANGADYMPTQALRTAEGVNSFTSDIVAKLQYEVEIYTDMVFIPALEAFLEVCKDNLQPEEIKRILSENEAKAYQGDLLDFYNSSCRIEVLASTKLAARKAAAQLIPLILQMVSAQPTQDALTSQGKKFNYEELLAESLDLAGWDCDALIVDATPEEIQRAMQMKPGAQKAAGEADLLEKQHENRMEEIQATAEGRAGNTVVKHLLDGSKEPSVLPGANG